MNIAIDQVKTILSGNSLVQDIDVLRQGHIRLETGFFYPDGSSVDVYLEKDTSLLSGIHPIKLTDFGNTISWLQNFDMKVGQTGSISRYVSSIQDTYQCRLKGAALETDVSSTEELPAAIIRLGQACIRTADLIYTKRLKAQNNFSLDVEDIVSNMRVEIEPASEIPTSKGTIIKVDFRVKGKRYESAVQTLSSANPSTAHARANEIFARTDDLRVLTNWLDMGNQCVTIFDDSYNAYDEKDLDRLQRISTVLPVSDTENIRNILEAA